MGPHSGMNLRAFLTSHSSSVWQFAGSDFSGVHVAFPEMLAIPSEDGAFLACAEQVLLLEVPAWSCLKLSFSVVEILKPASKPPRHDL